MKKITLTILCILLIGCVPHIPKARPGSAIAKYTEPAPSPTATIPAAKHWTVCVPALNVRVGPEPSYIQVGGVFQGDILTIYETDDQWGRIDPVEDMWVWMPCLCPPGEQNDHAPITNLRH